MGVVHSIFLVKKSTFFVRGFSSVALYLYTAVSLGGEARAMSAGPVSLLVYKILHVRVRNLVLVQAQRRAAQARQGGPRRADGRLGRLHALHHGRVCYYRGYPDKATAVRQYKLGRPIQWGAFSSTSVDLEVTKGFTDRANGVIFKITVTDELKISAKEVS